jgi:23S rRNA (cytosine1962-C5)-methyltransferase
VRRPETRKRDLFEAKVPDPVAQAVRRGHPWVYREALRGASGATGDEVRIVDGKGRLAGRGWLDADSPIAVRIWTTADRAVDEALLSERAESALALRDRLFGSLTNSSSGSTTAFRVTHGEGDRMPGVVADRYGDVAVLRLDGGAAANRLPAIIDSLWPKLEARGIRSLIKKQRGEALDVLRGPRPPERLEVSERGMRFCVDLAYGQKTGAFLDQRENRARVRALADGKRVLNLFSYAGGFSLAAALGGATQVTSVDIAAAAHKTAQESFRLNGIDPSRHRFAAADAFAWLAGAASRGERFDLVISDPPSFAPSEKAVARALRSYRDLHRACARVLAPGGLLCAASCSSHVDMDRFYSTLDDETLERSDLRVLESAGAPADHPTLPSFPEGRYLKFVVLG